MENIESIETFDKIIDDSIFDSENFPVKDRKRASTRRKKSYFKGKWRFDRLYQKGFTPFYKYEPTLRGMMRKTNIIRWYSPNDGTRQKGFNHSDIRRLITANDKLAEYVMED